MVLFSGKLKRCLLTYMVAFCNCNVYPKRYGPIQSYIEVWVNKIELDMTLGSVRLCQMFNQSKLEI